MTVAAMSPILTSRLGNGRAQASLAAQATFDKRYTSQQPVPMNASVAAIKYGWYGASCVKLPIYAPPMPRLKSTTGRMQQDDAARAPMTPPTAASFWPLSKEELSVWLRIGKDSLPFGVAHVVVLSCSSFYVLPIVATGASRSAMGSITSARAEELSIGGFSELTAVNIETIRYYERIKVLPAPPRTPGGRRVYDANHLRVLAFIRRSRELGFSLDEIRALIRLGGPAKVSCRQVRDIASQHLDNIRAKIADLRKLERLLAKTVARCTGTTAPDCPVLDILDIRRSK